MRDALADVLREFGWDVVPGCANFLLCHLPENGASAADVVRAARARGLFLREVENMGWGLGPHDLRIAVKDRVTNGRAMEILGAVLAELGADVERRGEYAAPGIA